MKKTIIIAISLFSSMAFSQVPTEQKSFDSRYRASKVVDGDTFIATDGTIKFKVRLLGVDAPEMKQKYGEDAKIFLLNLIGNQPIKLDPAEGTLDMYGRVLAKVTVGKTDVGLRMVEEGLATYYRPKCHPYPEDQILYNYDAIPYVKAEDTARNKRKYIWDSSISQKLPCEFRKKERADKSEKFNRFN